MSIYQQISTLVLRTGGVLVAYSLLFISLSSPFLLHGEVIAPYRQLIELGSSDIADIQHIENRKFSDYVTAYIPAITEHFSGARSGWLTLWSNNNEMGRPVNHIAGLSPAYLPSWLIARFTPDPWRFITALSLFTCFLSGIFLILFSREIGLSPLAGFIAGSIFATSPLFMYWLTFPMFPAVWTWAAGALWGIARLAKKADLVSWAILAFSIYSLLMTAYPQPVVYHAYLLTGYGLYLAYCKRHSGWIVTGRFLALSASALIAGIATALPVYIDLAHIAAESARIAPDPSFFTVVLPEIASLTEGLRFFVLGTMPELFGNPVRPDFPYPYDGLSITPLVVFFSIIALLVSYRQTWGWWLAIVLLFILAFVLLII